MVVQILQRPYAFDTEISRDGTTVLVPASPRFKCLDKMCLTLINPTNSLRDTNKRGRRQYHHLAECPSFSSITLTVAHENLTRPGNPNVLSSDASSHALVFGSTVILPQYDASGSNGTSHPPPGYPDPSSELQTAASDNDSASSHTHSSRQASRVTFAAILAALTILYFESALASTVNLIPGNKFDRKASWVFVGPSAST